MREQTVSPILTVLGQHPQGVTAREVAAELGISFEQASTTLSRLALYGVIDRAKAPSERPRRNRCFAYRIRQEDARV